MKWWKRLVLAVVSVIWGYVSLDYLYLAFQYLTGGSGTAGALQKKAAWELLGLALFLVWICLLAVYTWLIRKASPQVDIIERDEESGQERVKRKWFDVLLQYAFIVTGLCIRWAYLCLFYFPGT